MTSPTTLNTTAQVLATLCAAAAVVVGIFVAICGEGFIMAALANSSPATVQKAKYLMIAIAVATALCVAGSIVLMVKHSPWWAAGVGIAPAILIVVLLVIALVFEI